MSQTFISQKQIMDGFNKTVDDLIAEIRYITEENKHDDQMVAVKTYRAIQKWFRNGGKIKKKWS